MAATSITLSSGQTFIASGDSCADVRSAVRDQFGLALGTCGAGDDAVTIGVDLRYLNGVTGDLVTTPYTVVAVSEVVDAPMVWGSVPHLLQASLVVACVFALMMGFRSGDKL